MKGSATNGLPRHCFFSPLDVKLLDAKEPEAARGHFVGTQTLLRFQLLLHILDACFCAVVFMVGAMIVEDIVCEFDFPRMRILKLVDVLCVPSAKRWATTSPLS